LNLAAQETTEGESQILNINGYGRGMAFIGGDDLAGSVLMSELSLKTQMDYKNAYLYSDVRLRLGESLGEEISLLQIKELYAGYKGEKLDILLGDQIIVWGRTDGFSPNDHLNSSDYFFLTSEPDDQRLPNFMLRTTYRFAPQISLDLIAIPVYKPSVYRYELFDMGDNAQFSDVLVPEKTYENGSLAGRLNMEFSGVGTSLYGFYGYDPFYGFSLDTVDWSTGTPMINYQPRSYRKTTVGADFDLIVKSAILRGEFAYTFTEDYEENMYVPNPDLSYVLSLEYNIGTISAIAQYIGKYTFFFEELQEPVLLDPTNPLAQMAYANEMITYSSNFFNRHIFYQQEEMNHAISLILNGRFFYDILSIELAGYYNLTSEEYMVRPKLSYDISDRLKVAVGGYFMDGPEETPFNYSASVMNGVFMELKAGF
jgi:hypothetical protein